MIRYFLTKPNVSVLNKYEKIYTKNMIVLKHKGKEFAYVWEKDKTFRLLKIDSMRDKTFEKFAFVLEKAMKYKWQNKLDFQK